MPPGQQARTSLHHEEHEEVERGHTEVRVDVVERADLAAREAAIRQVTVARQRVREVAAPPGPGPSRSRLRGARGRALSVSHSLAGPPHWPSTASRLVAHSATVRTLAMTMTMSMSLCALAVTT